MTGVYAVRYLETGRQRAPGRQTIFDQSPKRKDYWPQKVGRCFANSMGMMLFNERHGASSRYEVLVGRTMAACIHPQAAWQSTVRSFRFLLFAGYFAAGYIAGLVAIALMN